LQASVAEPYGPFLIRSRRSPAICRDACDTGWRIWVGRCCWSTGTTAKLRWSSQPTSNSARPT